MIIRRARLLIQFNLLCSRGRVLEIYPFKFVGFQVDCAF